MGYLSWVPGGADHINHFDPKLVPHVCSIQSHIKVDMDIIPHRQRDKNHLQTFNDTVTITSGAQDKLGCHTTEYDLKHFCFCINILEQIILKKYHRTIRYRMLLNVAVISVQHVTPKPSLVSRRGNIFRPTRLQSHSWTYQMSYEDVISKSCN